MKIGKSLLFIVIIAFSFAGCKNVSEDVVGTWNFQTFDNKPQGTISWTFKDDGTLIRIATNDDGIKFDSCNYAVDKSLLKTQITINNSRDLPGYAEINGLYRIDKFKDDILVMTRIRLGDDSEGGAYLRCEMNRKN